MRTGPLVMLGGIACQICAALFFAGCASAVRYSRPCTMVSPDRILASRKRENQTPYHVPESRLSAVVQSYMGTPYRSGGMSRKGVDCSGFVCLVFREITKSKLPHSTSKMFKYGILVPRNEARPGDLIFFRGGIFDVVNHVGIYLGDGCFAQASSRQGVIKSSLDEKFFQDRVAGIRRLF